MVTTVGRHAEQPGALLGHLVALGRHRVHPPEQRAPQRHLRPARRRRPVGADGVVGQRATSTDHGRDEVLEGLAAVGDDARPGRVGRAPSGAGGTVRRFEADAGVVAVGDAEGQVAVRPRRARRTGRGPGGPRTPGRSSSSASARASRWAPRASGVGMTCRTSGSSVGFHCSVMPAPPLPVRPARRRRAGTVDQRRRYHRHRSRGPASGAGARPRSPAAGTGGTSDEGPMRTLVVAGEYPWPLNSGSRLRLATVLSGLAACGPTDLFSVAPARPHRLRTRPIRRWGSTGWGRSPSTTARPGGLARLAVAARPGLPFELPRPDGGAALRALTRFARGPYDLVWYFRVRPLGLTGGLVPAAGRPRPRRPRGPARSPPGWPSRPDRPPVTSAGSARRAGTGVLRPRRCGGGAGCSGPSAGRWTPPWCAASSTPAGRGRAGLPRVEVVPNGYRPVAAPVGTGGGRRRRPPCCSRAPSATRPTPRRPASWSTTWPPVLRDLVPGVRVRLVGRWRPPWPRLDDPPGGHPGRPGPRHRRRAGRAPTWWSCPSGSAAAPGSRSSRRSPSGSRWCRPPSAPRGSVRWTASTSWWPTPPTRSGRRLRPAAGRRGPAGPAGRRTPTGLFLERYTDAAVAGRRRADLAAPGGRRARRRRRLSGRCRARPGAGAGGEAAVGVEGPG